jgi:hypothetical protein
VVKDEEKAGNVQQIFQQRFHAGRSETCSNERGNTHLKSIDISEVEVCKLLMGGLQPE